MIFAKSCFCLFVDLEQVEPLGTLPGARHRRTALRRRGLGIGRDVSFSRRRA